MREFKAMVKIDLNRLARVSKVLLPAMFVFMIFRLWEERWEWFFFYGFYVLLAAMFIFYSDIGDDREEKTFLLLDVLPLRRRMVVISHCVMTSILLAVFEAMLVIVLVVGSALGVVVDSGWPAMAVGEIGIVLSIFSIMIPVHIGSKTSGGRWVFPALMALVVGFSIGILSAIQAGWSRSFDSWFLDAMPWMLLLVGLAAWATSLFVSIRNYELQDH